MTTIAFRDGVLAADEAEQREGEYCIRCDKLYRLGRGPLRGYVAAEYGTGVITQEIIQRLLCKEPERIADFDEHDDRESSGVVLLGPMGIKEIDWTLRPYPMTADFMAWGSGARFALGAMYMGATARQAILAACAFDINSHVYGKKVPTMRPTKPRGEKK